MNSRHGLFGAIILLVTILACSFGGELMPEPTALPAGPTATLPPSDGPTPPTHLEAATVARVVDGDTIELTDGRRVRYIGINTPEHYQPYYQEATEANRQLVEGREVQLEFDQETFDQYGRTLAYIWVEGQMVNLAMLENGFANAYTVPPNVKYEEEFRQAERAAREGERGLWAGSDINLKIVDLNADAPGSDKDNPNGEWVEIANQGTQTVQMQGYTLKDEANHIYTFDNFEVQPGDSFRLYSGAGQDVAGKLYWGFSDESVWNNNSDTAFLRDGQGALVDVYTY